MIKSFQHAGLEKFFNTGSKAGIQPAHAKKLTLQLSTLDTSTSPEGMRVVDGWDLHELKGDRQGTWSVKVNANWRLTFRFEDEDAILLNYEDYHK